MELDVCNNKSSDLKSEITTEVEDIMCDQEIITLNLDIENASANTNRQKTARLHLVVGLISQTVLPKMVNIYYAYVRNQQYVVYNFRHQLLPSLMAFIVNSVSKSLSSVQKGITYPIKYPIIYYTSTEPQSEICEEDNDETNTSSDKICDEVAEKSVDVRVLSEPSNKDEITADIIFVHGLHGGADWTWKQGDWEHEGHKINKQFPGKGVCNTESDNILLPKPSLKRTKSKLRSRTPKKSARKNNEECVCHKDDEWEVMEIDDFDLGNCNETPENGETFSTCWPRDWLQLDCPGVRVIGLSYDTDILWCPVWQKKRIRTGLIDRSNEMIEELIKIGVGKKPIVWVGHSKGGLFIKQIIVNAWEKRESSLNISSIWENSKAIMFFSVPHKGSSLADVTLPLMRRSIELLELQRNCQFLKDLHEKFLEVCNQENKPEIYSFIETSYTLMSILYIKIVVFDSADPGIGTVCGVPLDHREICKPSSRDCFIYTELVDLINRNINLT